MNPWYPQVAQRACHRCEYCHAPEVVFNAHFEVDHVIPRSYKGADEIGNLALCCRACNVKKSDRLTGIDESSDLEVRLFNPREDRWEEHFQIDSETGEILGRSPLGRVAVAILDLNDPSQLQARRHWMQLKFFP